MIEGMVSTIIPVYNRGAMLREAVASVQAQTWRPIEIVIVDDGSTDDTAAVAEDIRIADPGTIRVLRQANAGPGVARQTGLEASRGEFIQFLDSDDLLTPKKFELQVQGLREDREAGISYGYSQMLRELQGESLLPLRSDRKHREIFPAILNRRLWPTAAPLYRREVCLAVGPWSRKRVLEDWDYDCRAGILGVKLHFCDDVLVRIRFHGGEHAGRAWRHDESAMRDRVTAYIDVLGFARQAGVTTESPEMQQFVRSLFWMARGAGDYGLTREAEQLFKLSRTLSIRPGWDYRLFGMATKLIGWRWTSRLANAMYRRRLA